jgi:hypothetical protein
VALPTVELLSKVVKEAGEDTVGTNPVVGRGGRNRDRSGSWALVWVVDVVPVVRRTKEEVVDREIYGQVEA